MIRVESPPAEVSKFQQGKLQPAKSLVQRSRRFWIALLLVLGFGFPCILLIPVQFVLDEDPAIRILAALVLLALAAIVVFIGRGMFGRD